MKRISSLIFFLSLFFCLIPPGHAQQYHLRNYSIEDGLAGISVNAIFQDSRGYIWIGTQDGGISRFDGKEFINTRKKNGLGDNWVNCIFEDQNGNMWFGTENNGIVKFDGQSFVSYNDQVKKVDKIFTGSNGEVLISSNQSIYELKGDSIVLFADKSAVTEESSLAPDGLIIKQSIVDQRGNKWIATNAGVFLIKKEFAGAVDAYDHKIFISLSDDRYDEPASSLVQDREGNIWIGTVYHGLYVFVDGAFSNFNNFSSLQNAFVTSINKTAGQFFIGTSNGMVVMNYDESTSTFKEVPFTSKNYKPGAAITTIYKNKSDEIFAADANNNLLHFTSSFKHFTIPEIPLSTSITSMTQDAFGNLWIATSTDGVFIWNKQLIGRYTKNDSLVSNQISCLFTDSKNNIWIATHDAGIQKFDGSAFTPYSYFENGLINDNISTIAEGPDGLMWFGSEEGGLCSFDGTMFSHYSENDLLSSNAVHSLAFDKKGNLWVGLANGIDKLEFPAGQPAVKKHYDEYDGFSGIKNNLSSIFTDEQGHTWFGTVAGLFRYNPGEDFNISAKPLVELKVVRLMYEQADLNEYSDTVLTWNNIPLNLELPYNKNHLSFDFAALVFAVPEKINYEVMLKGFDDNWKPQGNNPTMSYSNLTPGDYTFMVRAVNAEGVWSEPVSFSFVILKPFWATWGFRIAAGIVALALIWFIYSWRNRQLRARAKLLELQVEERTAELHQQKIRAEEAAERAARSEKTKEEFLANMSHEIRTPMNAIMGMTRLLIEKDPKETQLKYLKAIRQSSDNLLVIINDILDLSKIDAGKMELEQVPFMIRNLLNNLGEIMRFKSDEKGLAFEIDIDPAVPECIIGDPVRLTQILINLTGNAIKFTEEGKVKVVCKPISSAINSTRLSFIVMDTGVGIAPDKIASIFESFSQADKATTRKFGGTGLGLSISKKLAELGGGVIKAESELGKGSSFIVELPFEIGNPADAIDNKSNIVIDAEALANDLHILLVEDNTFNQMVAIDSIESYFTNAKIDVAENGKIALEKLDLKNYSLVLMDVQMPVMDGYETAKAIRKLTDNKKRNIPIVAMTASVIKSEVDKCYESGMTDFISKPFESEDLMQKISKYAQAD